MVNWIWPGRTVPCSLKFNLCLFHHCWAIKKNLLCWMEFYCRAVIWQRNVQGSSFPVSFIFSKLIVRWVLLLQFGIGSCWHAGQAGNHKHISYRLKDTVFSAQRDTWSSHTFWTLYCACTDFPHRKQNKTNRMTAGNIPTTDPEI